jgi:hypothetical protein
VPASERSAYTEDSYEHDTAAEHDDDGNSSSIGDHEGNEDPATAVYLVVSPTCCSVESLLHVT